MRNDPEEMISKTPTRWAKLSTNGTSTDVVSDDVNPVTDIVTEKDNVTDPEKDPEKDPVVIELVSSVVKDELKDDERTEVISAPGIVATYCPLPAGSSVSAVDSSINPELDPLEILCIDCEKWNIMLSVNPDEVIAATEAVENDALWKLVIGGPNQLDVIAEPVGFKLRLADSPNPDVNLPVVLS